VIETSLLARRLELAKDVVSDSKRVVFLNALPLNAVHREVVNIKCVKLSDIILARHEFSEILSELKAMIREREIVNYIRHESTVKLLSNILGVELKPSSDLYKYKCGDALVVVTLNKPQRGQEVEVKEEDLEYFVCKVF
jgi:hypothetical protein